MHVQDTTVYGADVRGSVSNRISWGAICAGVIIALSMQFLLTLLGTAAGLSLSDRTSNRTLQNSAMIYMALTIFASLFVGGVVTTLMTGGENRQEAIISGFVMWGVALVAVLFLGAAGVQGGVNLFNTANNARAQTGTTWEDSARQAGVTDAQINDWRAQNKNIAAQAQDPATQQAAKDAATRATWYAFFITWISMLFAAGGAYVGAGETFRIVSFGAVGRSDDRRGEGRIGQGLPAAT